VFWFRWPPYGNGIRGWIPARRASPDRLAGRKSGIVTQHHHSLGRESIVVGLIGAAAVALWFLIIDSIAGRPFTTPSILGQVVLFRQTTPNVEVVQWNAVAAYTGLHLAAFLGLGGLITRLVFWADRNALARFALLMLFVVFEVLFYGFITMFFEGTRGLFPFWSILAANTFAAAAMGWYLYRRHPALRRALAREPLGA
jgi:hypothetical protein